MDKITKKVRSDIMRKVKSKNTSPEMRVRSLLHRLGYRFRLHRKDLPGNPDICLPKHKTVIFVHGCFWHRHPGCKRATMPATNEVYWSKKFERNVNRDRQALQDLEDMSWNAHIVWECETKDPEQLANKLISIFPKK